MARTKKKVAEEVTEEVTTTEDVVSEETVSEEKPFPTVVDLWAEENPAEFFVESQWIPEDKEEQGLKPTFVEIYYTKWVTSVEANYVKKALDKAEFKDYLFLELNNCSRNWLKEHWIRWEFAVVIPVDSEQAIVTNYKTALKLLKDNGKI